MAITNLAGHRSELGDSSAITRHVAEDMAAIFGAGVRTSAETPPLHRGAVAGSDRPRQLVGVAAALLIAATVAAGIFAGKSVTAVPAAAPSSRTGGQAQPPVIGTQPRQSAGLATTAAGTLPLAPAPAVVGVAPPTPIPQATPVRENPAMTADAVAPPPVPASQAAAMAMRDLAPAVANEPAAPAPPEPRRASCDDESETCLVSRIELADRRFDETFEQAAAAGVRRQELRDFLREWDRARTESVRQPRDALRRYAMITSDLRDLADVAAAREGATIR